MYQQGKTLEQSISRESVRTQKSVTEDFGVQFKMIANLLDYQFEIVNTTAWLLGQQHLSGRNETEVAVFSAVHKNFFLFYAAITLSKSGMYGPAETLLRPIFESLYIAKYCALSKSRLTFDRWIEGEHVHLTNEIFNRIKSSALPETRALWKALNKLSHASVYAQQISANYKEIKNNIGICLALIQILAVLNHHLLARHYLTPQVIRLMKVYGDSEAFETARVSARKQVANIHSILTSNAKRVVREFVSTWEIKS
jgi:hypothetical protein